MGTASTLHRAGRDYPRNRLNVAISRAWALAYVICTEDLLDTWARTVDEMRLIGTLCAFVEAAQRQLLSAPAGSRSARIDGNTKGWAT